MRTSRTAVLLIWGLTATGLWLGVSSAPAAESPTGRRPRIHWTPEWQDAWNRAAKENHIWWQRLEKWADATGTGSARYADCGEYATLAYQMTGDVRYARKAWEAFLPVLKTMRPAWNSRNGTRESFITYVWMYDWLYPALTVEERRQFIDYLNHLADLCLNRVKDTRWGTRLGDSDETTGHYFGLAFLDLATGPDNPRAGTFLNGEAKPGARVRPVGGLDATGADFRTMRNTIRRFTELARGGCWVESAEYNTGTLKLLVIGARGVRTATGVDHFPEVTALIPQIVREQAYQQCPDFVHKGQWYQWGDCEHPRDPKTSSRVTLFAVLAGLTQADADVGPCAQQMVEELSASNRRGAMPYPRFFLFYNPYAAKADWRDKWPRGYYAPGQGILYFRDGWDDQASWVCAHMPNQLGVDHEVGFLGNFQIFRKGEWALTHPIAYGGNSGDRMNSMLIGGLSSMRQVRGALTHEFGPKEEYAYLVGVTGGQWGWNGYYDPPPTFLHEWTRSVLYLPSAEGRCDTVIVFDRVNAKDPKKLPKLDRYRKTKAAIEAAPALKQWVIHMPVKPVLAPEAITWSTPNGQNVRVSTLLPAKQVKVTYDEKKIGIPGYHHKREEKWQARLWPEEEKQWDTFLNVVQVYDDGVKPHNTVVRSAGGEAEGVLVRREAHPEVLVMFGAAPGPELPGVQLRESRSRYDPKTAEILKTVRLRKEGYTVGWTTQADGTDVFLMDLDPDRQWKAVADGGAERVLEVSPQGVARLAVPGAGAHTLQLR